jgi:uncharacterized UBP type Zn finger protein
MQRSVVIPIIVDDDNDDDDDFVPQRPHALKSVAPNRQVARTSAGAHIRDAAALTASATVSHRAIGAQHANPASVATETALLPAVQGGQTDEDDFKEPSMTLYSSAKIDAWIKWTSVRSAGRALNNLGNTCFLNAALQCLSYTPPLAAYLASREHSQSCRASGNAFCMLCAMERLQLELTRPGRMRAPQAVTPDYIVRNIRAIGNRFRAGRQEDSHEFIRLALDAMQSNALASVPHAMDQRVKETSVIHQIFGGYLRSQIRCEACKACSNKYDAFLDLSVDVNETSSLEGALRVRAFFLVRYLDSWVYMSIVVSHLFSMLSMFLS